MTDLSRLELRDIQAMHSELIQIFMAIARDRSRGLEAQLAAQTGRILGYANGGIVPAMLEPSEAFFPTMNMSQQHALTAMNAAFPRFGGGIVPGVGDGDTVPAFLPVGSGILNRNATRALQGAQRVQVGPGPLPRARGQRDDTRTPDCDTPPALPVRVDDAVLPPHSAEVGVMFAPPSTTTG